MSIAVTGAQGFLGRRVVELLLAQGRRVRAITRRPAPELQALGAETICADLGESRGLAEALVGVRGLIHCAAQSGIWGETDMYIRANTLTTINVLNAARRTGTRWLLYTSSPSAVHSGRPLEGVNESAPYTRESRYGYPYSKMLAERIVLAASEPGFSTAALRPHLIWGPRDPHFLPRLTQRARAGRLWLIKSEALVDATYIDNAAEAHLLAAEKLEEGANISGRVYFIGQGEPLSCRQLVEALLKAGAKPGEELKIRGFIPASLALFLGGVLERLWPREGRGEPPLTRFVAEELSLPHWFNLEAARRDLSYRATVSTAEGLERLAAWVRAEG